MSQYTGPFTKGFEGLWRAASKVTVVYLLLLIFILYQTADDARQLLKHLDPELGKPLWWGSLDASCGYKWRYVYESLDIFYVRDLAGWFFTTLIVRDVYALYFCSFLIQFFGISFLLFPLTYIIRLHLGVSLHYFGYMLVVSCHCWDDMHPYSWHHSG